MPQETPWSSISPLRFLRDVASNGPATLTVEPRGEVATGYWWALTFVADDGRERAVVASDLALLMRRAAEAELAAREAWARAAEDAPHGPSAGTGAAGAQR
jgi:hypothetical protein